MAGLEGGPNQPDPKLTWTSPSDANRISEKSHVLRTRSEMGRACDQLHFIIIILFGPRR
jgi:hypothetical protein